MTSKRYIAIGLLTLVLLPIRAEDFLKEAQEENSPLVKLSSDHRVKATILYVGPMKQKYLDYVFIIAYLVEDCSSDEQYTRNITANPPPPGYVSKYDLWPTPLEVKDGSHQVVGHPGGNYLTYKEALGSDFQLMFPHTTLPTVEHPTRSRIYQCFYKSILAGPLDITLHDNIPAYGENSFHFRDVDITSSSP